MQLVAYGAQDIYLTGNPQITFFKVVYRRHTNFAIESIEQTFNGSANFGRKFAVTVARNGDLLGQVSLEADLEINVDGILNNSDNIGDMKYSTKSADFNGWLLCDGRFVDKRRYKRLFSKIGYNFGSDSTNSYLFRLPDARNKVIAAVGDTYDLTVFPENFAVGEGNFDTLNLINNTYNLPTGTKVKLEANNISNNASFWNDWGNDVFDDWGYFYLFNPITDQYYFPQLSPINNDDGIITTQVFTAFGKTFTIKHGYPVQGIFKFDINCSDPTFNFVFGAYGDMGSDSDGINTNESASYTLNSNEYTLYYNKNVESGDLIERFFSYFIPYDSTQNNAKTYTDNVWADDMLSLYSNVVNKGLTVYFSKKTDVKDWVIDDLQLVSSDIKSKNNLSNPNNFELGHNINKDMEYGVIDDDLPVEYSPSEVNGIESGSLPVNYPAPLTQGEFYYIIKINNTTVKLALTLDDAFNNNPITLTSDMENVSLRIPLFGHNMGEVTGSDKHKLTGYELTTHTHNVQDPGHSHYQTSKQDDYNNSSAYPNTTYPSYPSYDSGNDVVWTNTINSNGTGIYLDTSGNDQNHTIIQPTIYAGNLFIYAGDATDVTIINTLLKDHYIRWGFQLIDYVEVEIGGQLIDKHYGEWMDIWAQLTYSAEKYQELLSMINCSILSIDDNNNTVAKVYIPLQFWFCRNPGLYLPLIALQYHEVKINVQLNNKSDLNTATQYTSNVVRINNFNYTSGSHVKTNFIESILDMKVYCNYVFLDTDERRRFAQVSHEYLIEQVQTSGIFTSKHQNVEIPLRFNHPCKTLIWRGQRTNFTYSDNASDYPYDDQYFLGSLYDYGRIGGNTSTESAEFRFNNDIVKNVKLQFNGLDRFKPREGSYFRLTQPFEGISLYNSSLSLFNNGLKRYGGGFYNYNFGLRIDEHQPSGTCNFSRLDNATLFLNINPYASSSENNVNCYDYNFRAFTVNYNVLRVMSGMGGLAYSN